MGCPKRLSRREFLQLSAVGGAGLLAANHSSTYVKGFSYYLEYSPVVGEIWLNK